MDLEFLAAALVVHLLKVEYPKLLQLLLSLAWKSVSSAFARSPH